MGGFQQNHYGWTKAVSKEEEVRKLLATLDEKKATGPDNISAWLLCMVAPAISDSITSLFNICLSHGEFPSE